MRFDSVNPLLVLGNAGSFKYRSEDEEVGFFDKLFRKNKKNDVPPFESAIERIGRDVLEKEILDDEYILAYTVDKDRTELYVVLTENYLIMPGKDIVPLESVRKYGLFNELNPGFAQYAEDRLNIPYDPNFVSEYEGEETYELDRFGIMFAYVDQFGICYKYTIYMEASDRREFYEYLSGRIGDKVDYTSSLVIEGKFEEDDFYNPFHKMLE